MWICTHCLVSASLGKLDGESSVKVYGAIAYQEPPSLHIERNHLIMSNSLPHTSKDVQMCDHWQVIQEHIEHLAVREREREHHTN